MSATPPPLPILDGLIAGSTVASGRYRLTRKLQAGGNGMVWLAKHAAMGADVVIKFPRRWTRDNPGVDEQLEREVHSLVAFSSRHPHIVNILDIGDYAGRRFIVTQFMKNGSLLDSCSHRKQSPYHNSTTTLQTLGWLTQISSALDFIHQAGLIHRDVKPANVLLDDSLSAYLADFGIAINDRPKGFISSWVGESEQSLIGSIPYVAPELFAGQSASSASDQFALAVSVFEFAFGKVPFPGKSGSEVFDNQSGIMRSWNAQHLIPGLTDRESLVMLRAMASDPLKRYLSCSEFASELARVWQGLAQCTPDGSSTSDTKRDSSPTAQIVSSGAVAKRPKPRLPLPPTTKKIAESKTLPLRRLFDRDDAKGNV